MVPFVTCISVEKVSQFDSAAVFMIITKSISKIRIYNFWEIKNSIMELKLIKLLSSSSKDTRLNAMTKCFPFIWQKFMLALWQDKTTPCSAPAGY